MQNTDEIQRFLNDKERENQRLKKELNLLKSKIQGNPSDNENQSEPKQNYSQSSSIDNSEIQPQERKFTLDGKTLKPSKSSTGMELPDKRFTGIILSQNTDPIDNNGSFMGKTDRNYGMSHEEDLEYKKRFSHLYLDQRKNSNLNLVQNYKTSSINLSGNNRKTSAMVKFSNIKTSDLNNDIRDESPLPQSHRKHSRNNMLKEFSTNINQNDLIETSPFATSRVHRHKSFVQIDKANNDFTNCTTDRETEHRRSLLRRRHTEKPIQHDEIDTSSNPVVQNIQSNIHDIKNQLTNYEKVVDTIHSKIDMGSVDKIKALNNQINELQVKLRLCEEEKAKQKENSDAELATKKEVYEQNLSFLKQAHQEELTKLRIDHELKLTSQREEYESV